MQQEGASRFLEQTGLERQPPAAQLQRAVAKHQENLGFVRKCFHTLSSIGRNAFLWWPFSVNH